MIEIKKVEEIKMKLTQSDVDKIKEEIEHRKLVVRKEAIEAVKEAKSERSFEVFQKNGKKIQK